MSRSKKKHPGGGAASSCGQHKFKKDEARAKRRKVRKLMSTGQHERLPHDKEYGNEWSSPRDGKQYWVDHDAKWMRK